MRISELSKAGGVPVATIKYYLREGILPSGEPRGATQADYGDEHLRRLRLIRSLADLAGLPIAQIKVVLGLIDHPHDDLFATLGEAMGALPPYPPRAAAVDRPLAKAAIQHLGWTYDADFTATAQLELALRAVADAGMPLGDDRLDAYGAALHGMAEVDIAMMPAPSDEPGAASDAVAYAVLGTALYEPVVMALRRLAHQDVAARTLSSPANGRRRPLQPE
jgi:DNA-binding transcriptional MerR regulator